MTDEKPDGKLTREEVEAIRARAQAAIALGLLNQRQAAHEANIPYGTFTPWLSGKYAGDESNVARKVRRWLDSRELRTEIRSAAPRNVFVEMPTSSEIRKVLAHAQHMPDIVTITGNPGVGKTETTRAYQRANPHVWRVEMERAHNSVRAMLGEIATTLGIYDSGSQAKISRQIQERFRGTNGLLIIDEANHCNIEMLDQARAFYDKCQIGIAFVGSDVINERLLGGKRPGEYSQLTRRVGIRVPHVRKPRAGDIKALMDAWQITEMPVRDALRAVALQPGALGAMQRTHRMAQMLANFEDRDLTVADIEDAYRQRQQDTQGAGALA